MKTKKKKSEFKQLWIFFVILFTIILTIGGIISFIYEYDFTSHFNLNGWTTYYFGIPFHNWIYPWLINTIIFSFILTIVIILFIASEVGK